MKDKEKSQYKNQEKSDSPSKHARGPAINKS